MSKIDYLTILIGILTWRCLHLTLTLLTAAPGVASAADHCPGSPLAPLSLMSPDI